MNEVPAEAESPVEESGVTRQASKYFIVYRDGEISQPLSKPECVKTVQDDDDSGNIKDVFFGRRVEILKKKKLEVTLN